MITFTDRTRTTRGPCFEPFLRRASPLTTSTLPRRSGTTVGRSIVGVAISKRCRQVKVVNVSSAKINISQTVTDRENITVTIKRKSYISFLLTYLHLILAHSKGRGRDRANFYCRHLENSSQLHFIVCPCRPIRGLFYEGKSIESCCCCC